MWSVKNKWPVWLTILLCNIVHAQKIELFNINTNEYPIISANFSLLDTDGNPVFNIEKSSVQVFEEGITCKLPYFKSPREFEQPVSIVLAFDVSGSMDGKRLQIARDAAKAFIDEVALMYSEVAIVSFNHQAIINTDFTHSYNRLMYAVSTLMPGGGTSYNNSFFTSNIGIFDLVDRAKYTPHVVFLTDGLSEPSTDSIIKFARARNTSIYCTTIDLPIPKELINISQQTNGNYFNQINNQYVGKTIYKNLYREIQAANFGTIRWVANMACGTDQRVTFKMNGVKYHASYKIPRGFIGELQVFPDIVVFDSLNKPWPIELGVKNNQLTITGITYQKLDTPAKTTLNLPANIQPNTRNVVSIFPPNGVNGVYFDKLKIQAGNCDSVELKVMGGAQPKIILNHPVGGEIFAVTSSIPIRWSGISKYKDVDIFYRKRNQDWLNMGTYSEYLKNWKTPVDSGDYQVVIRPTSNFDLSEKIRIEDIKAKLSSVSVSSDGDYILTRDAQGNTKVFSTTDGELVDTYYQYSAPVIFSNDSKYTLGFSNSGVQVNGLGTADLLEVRPNAKSRIVQTFRTSAGNELNKPVQIGINKHRKTEIYDPVYGHKLTVDAITRNTEATIGNKRQFLYYLSGERELTIHNLKQNTDTAQIKLPKNFKRIIISPDGWHYAILLEDGIYAGTWGNEKPSLKIKNQQYEFFSPAGDKIITRDYNGDFVLWDIDEGKALLAYNRPAMFVMSPNDEYLFVYQNDQFIYHKILRHNNATKVRPATSRFVPLLTGFDFSADSKYFSFVTSGKAEFFFTNNPVKPLAKLSDKGVGFEKVFFRNAENEMIFQNTDNSISIFTPKVSTKEAQSGWFKLVKPGLIVQTPLQIGKVYLGQSKEVLFDKFIHNNNPFHIVIDSIEIENIDNVHFNIISTKKSIEMAPGQKAGIEIKFAPRRKGKFQGVLKVWALDTVYHAIVEGEGVEQPFKILNEIIDFGALTLNCTKDTLVPVLLKTSTASKMEYKLSNLGPDTLQFSLKNGFIKNDTFWADLSYRAQKSGTAMNNFRIHLPDFDGQVNITAIGRGLATNKLVVYGKVLDNKGTAIETQVTCTDVDAKRRYAITQTGPDRFYAFDILPERKYGLFAEAEGYFSSSEFVDPRQVAIHNDSIRKDIILSKLEKGTHIRSGLIFFEVDKADLLPTSVRELQRILVFLNKNSNIQIEIQGHTDSDGTHASNMVLSQKRADAVKNYLIGQGINNTRLSTKAFGETKPIATNKTDEGKQQNRRVEILVR